MTLAEITAEMVARGAEDNATRNNRWANFAYREIGNAYDWPFTETAVTGTALAGFVSVPLLRKVIIVGDVSRVSSGSVPGWLLDKILFQELAEDMQVDTVTTTGSPDFWWYDATVGQIKGYPFGGTIYARYHQRLDELTLGQSPVFDEEHHGLVVERAMVDVYNDTSEFESAKNSLMMFERGLLKMADAYQVLSREHSFIQAGETFDG